jgi:hypothetical protein
LYATPFTVDYQVMDKTVLNINLKQHDSEHSEKSGELINYFTDLTQIDSATVERVALTKFDEAHCHKWALLLRERKTKLDRASEAAASGDFETGKKAG